MCHTPPRVVTHHICVPKPSSSTSPNRSRSWRTPIRPVTHHARSSPNAARPALIPDSHWSAVAAPTAATSGMSTTAGNGANGT